MPSSQSKLYNSWSILVGSVGLHSCTCMPRVFNSISYAMMFSSADTNDGAVNHLAANTVHTHDGAYVASIDVCLSCPDGVF